MIVAVAERDKGRRSQPGSPAVNAELPPLHSEVAAAQ